MMTAIQVRIGNQTVANFLRALNRNLDQIEASRVLVWIRDQADNFHTRIHYGQHTVVLLTQEMEGKRRFSSLVIQAATQPLEPENADTLIATVSRADLGVAAALADGLVQRLEFRIAPEAHDLTRILEKFCYDNRSQEGSL